MSKALKLTGKVLESGYEHPHGQLRFAGPGATLTVEGYPSRDRPGEMRAERVTIDGRTIELR